jgi:conjugal transfer pilus assembly protein TraU
MIKDILYRIQKILFILFICTFSLSSLAGGVCHGKFANPITDVCWSCLFPISIGSISVFSGGQPDTTNPSSPICTCPMVPTGVRIGISLGYWEPVALVDVTRSPYCMVNLGGLQLATGAFGESGGVANQDPAHGGSFYYVHWYKFPLLYWFNLLTDALCIEKGDFDVAYLTELDPTWKDDELTFLLNPEALLFGNLVAQAACSADSISTLAGLPIDSLFWCAGSQGSMYPLNGVVQEHVGGVQASTLLTERMTYKMHREGLLWSSVGQNSPALCTQYPSPIIPKSRYRYQMVNPIPAASSGENGCHPFGHTTSIWGSLHEYPYAGEDFGYLVWKKRNCCAG